MHVYSERRICYRTLPLPMWSQLNSPACDNWSRNPSSHENDHRTTSRIHAAHTYNYMRTNSVYLMPDVIAQPTEHSIDVNRRSSPVWTVTLTTLPQNGSQTIYGMKITTNFVHGPSK